MNPRVFVYWNLHKHCFSIRMEQGPERGRVVGHAHHVTMVDVEFRVSEAGRQRVIATGKKNVHAGMVGALTSASAKPNANSDGFVRVASYNPRKAATFVDKATGEPLSRTTRISAHSGVPAPVVWYIP